MQMSDFFSTIGYAQAATVFVPFVSQYLPLEIEYLANYALYNDNKPQDADHRAKSIALLSQTVNQATQYCHSARAEAMEARLNTVRALQNKRTSIISYQCKGVGATSKSDVGMWSTLSSMHGRLCIACCTALHFLLFASCMLLCLFCLMRQSILKTALVHVSQLVFESDLTVALQNVVLAYAVPMAASRHHAHAHKWYSTGECGLKFDRVN